MRSSLLSLVLIAAGLAAALPALSQKKPAKTVWDGVYTADQATRGLDTYKNKCAGCHAADMNGGPGAPAISGPAFLFNWNNKTAAELFDYIHTMMPPGEAGSISDRRYVDLIAAILKTSEFPAGKADLPSDPAALQDILILREKP